MIELDVKDFPTDFVWDNGQFPPLDALTYWHFLKQAKRCIEIGCGFSTYLAKKSNVELTAIDPNPRIIHDEVNYIKQNVQEVSLSIFKELQKDDILFVDSSHEYYKGSDVNHIFLNILPILNKGVLLQFHDYFYPDDYPEDWKKTNWGKNWNENKHVALLENEYEVLVVNNTISKENNDERIAKYPFVPLNITKNFPAVKGSSVWFRV